jgi:hypothetical protein
MTATAHALVAGALAARFANDPVTAMALALTSHFVMDSIPHWDFGTNWRSRPKKATGIYAIGETAFGIACSWFFFGAQAPMWLWTAAVLMSVLPDWLETPWYIWYANAKKHEPGPRAGAMERLSFAFYKIPNVFHAKAQLPLGLITQVVTVGFFLILLK